jgi:catechol 2,3-dioxygenase-like lactoylglutathione lyase family enzyme
MKRHVPAFVVASLLVAGGASAQSDVRMAYWSLNVSDLEASKRFFVALGATPGRTDSDAVEFPGVTVYLRVAAPSGGTVGTVVDHVGLNVKDIQESIRRFTAARLPVEPSERRADQAWLLSPDGLRIEFLEDPSQEHPIQHHHIHYYVPQDRVADVQGWYARVFGAVPGRRGNFDAADIPGANLTFQANAAPNVGTRGRALDHVGFEVVNLGALCQRLEASGIRLDRPCERDPRTGRTQAYLFDPLGAYIGLTERP